MKYMCFCLLILASSLFSAPQPSDLRVPPMLSTAWGQTVEPVNYASGTSLACFNYYTPDSSGYPPSTPGSVTNYPSGCVATAMAQLVNYNQWAVPQFPYMTRFTIYADGISYQAYLMGGTLGGNYDWLLMQNIVSSLQARQEVGRLLHDLGIALTMQYYSWANWGSATDFDYIDDVFIGFSYSNAVTLEGNAIVNGQLSPLSISPLLAEPAIKTNLDAQLPVLIGINDNALQSGHVLVLDGYGYDSTGKTWFHYNFGLPVQGVTYPAVNDGPNSWFTLPGVGSTNDSAGYTVLDGIALNIFKAGSVPAHTGEIISGCVRDSSSNPINSAQITISCPADPGFAPVTVYTNAVGIFAYYGTINPNKTYMLDVSAPGYANKTTQCNVGITQKNWITTNSPSPGDGYYSNSLGNVRSEITLVPKITLPPVQICDFKEFANISKYWNTTHSSITAPDVCADYDGDWGVNYLDLIRICNAWLNAPVEFRTEFQIFFDIPGQMPPHMPWLYAGQGGPWAVVSSPVLAAQSPAILDSQSTSLKLPVKAYPGPAGIMNIMFDLQCDTQLNADVFEFLVDGVIQTELMTSQSAFSGQLNLPMHYQLNNITEPCLITIEWRYTKNASVSVGADKVWISNINVSMQP